MEGRCVDEDVYSIHKNKEVEINLSESQLNECVVT